MVDASKYGRIEPVDENGTIKVVIKSEDSYWSQHLKFKPGEYFIIDGVYYVDERKLEALKSDVDRKAKQLKNDAMILVGLSNIVGGTYKVGAKAIKTVKTVARGRRAVSGADSSDSIHKAHKEIGPASDKKKPFPDWVKERIEKGNQFNRDNRNRYTYNEITVEGSNKNRVVDSYERNEEIVSRKFTQLSSVAEKTAIGYINEIVARYHPGTKITDSPFNPNTLKGKTLKGGMILEIPVQNKPIPQRILDVATEKKVTIRDIEGKVY